jgi:hypothetical protein
MEATDTSSAEGVIGDATGSGEAPSHEMTEAFLEIIEGKNEDGSPKKRALSREEALKMAQLGFGADSKFQEAAKSREEAMQLKQKMAQLSRIMQDDPFQVLKAFGRDPDAYVADYFERKLQDSLIDPKDRELGELRSKLSAYEQAQEEARKKAQEEAVNARAEALRGQLLEKIESVLSTSGVPKTPRTIAEVARYLQIASQQGKDPMNFPVEHIVKHLQQTRRSEFEELYGALDEDGILNNMDSKLLEKFARAMSKKLGAQPIRQVKPKDDTIFANKKEEEDLIDAHKRKIAKLQKEWEKVNGKPY